MKVHVGCGSIYLNGYLNVDLPLPNVFTTCERPALVEALATTEGDYYGRHVGKSADTLRGGPITQETVCDAYGSFAFLPVRDAVADEILARQCFEHLSPAEGSVALRECARVLKFGGVLRLDLPDPDETLKLYRDTGDEFYIRHLFGPRRDQYGGHTPYTRTMLTTMAESAGFALEQEEENIHFYPAFCLRFERA